MIIMNENSELFAPYFHENIKTNFCFENSIFPFDLKLADITPAFKKISKTSKITTDPFAFT